MIAELIAAVPWQALYDVVSFCTIVVLVLAVTGLTRIVFELDRELSEHRGRLNLLLNWRDSELGPLHRRISLGVIETKGPLAR